MIAMTTSSSTRVNPPRCSALEERDVGLLSRDVAALDFMSVLLKKILQPNQNPRMNVGTIRWAGPVELSCPSGLPMSEHRNPPHFNIQTIVRIFSGCCERDRVSQE